MAESAFVSGLPEGWVPEGTVVWVLVHRDEEDGPWEALVPEFTIASQGPTPEDALRSVAELVDDYLVLCHREGKTFEESRRAVNARMTFDLLAHGVAAFAKSKIRSRHGPRPGPPRRHRLLRLPLDDGLFAH